MIICYSHPHPSHRSPLLAQNSVPASISSHSPYLCSRHPLLIPSPSEADQSSSSLSRIPSPYPSSSGSTDLFLSTEIRLYQSEFKRNSLRLTPVTLRSTWISTTSPSINSVSSFIRTPIDLRNACVNDSVFDIYRHNQHNHIWISRQHTSNENTSDAVSITKGTSVPSV